MAEKKENAAEAKDKEVKEEKKTGEDSGEKEAKAETSSDKGSGEKKEAKKEKAKDLPTPKDAPKGVEMTENKKEELANFDWETFGIHDDEYTDKARKEMEEMYNDTITTINEQDVVDGTVVSKNDREIVVNIGYKSEGVIPTNETRHTPDLGAGDKIEVFIEAKEDKNGQLVLSHKKARTLRAWDKVNEALETQEIIKGHVKCRTKGGLIADVFGIEAFLPGSQIDVKPIRDYDQYVGKNMEFKVVKINKEYKNVVVSHKALIEEELEQQKKEIISKLEKGQVLEGTVKNITSYGVFIDLGGVDGLVHITDLSWGRINHPEEVVELDEKVNVVILDFDDDKKRIALGIKQLEKHPWENLEGELNVGDKVKGKVVVVADYGAFVEVQPGVEGLVHVSEISWSNQLKPAQEYFTVGDEVEAVILTLDREERKMSLGVKQLTPDPWEGIEEKFPVDSKHKGKVTNISDFGIFVELEEGVDGLVHISDLSWSKKINHPKEIATIGDEMEVVILEIDKDNRRLSLGHKQLEENPWDVYESVFKVGSEHEGRLTEVSQKGGVVELPYGVEGTVTKSNLEKEDGSEMEVDEKAKFKVIDFNKRAKKIVVSHTQLFKEMEEPKPKRKKSGGSKAGKRATKNVRQNLEKTTLGDLDALSSLKTEMEGEGEKKEEKKTKKKTESKKSGKKASDKKSEKKEETSSKKKKSDKKSDDEDEKSEE